MPLYQVAIFPTAALQFIGGGPASFSNGGGVDWQWQAYSFTLNPAGLVSAQVNDADGLFQDDPANPEWSGGTFTQHQQVLSQPLTIGGQTWPAGMQIEDEYELNVTDAAGTTYRMAAVSVFNGTSFTVIGFTFDGAVPPPGSTLTSVPGSNQEGPELAPAVVCYCAGTRIGTPEGPRRVEDLVAGDRVLTLDGRAEPLIWVGRRRVAPADLALHPHLRPVRIAAGALGPGLPERELRLSPQHRLLIRSAIVARMLGGAEEALVAAKHLVGLPGIALAEDGAAVSYHHLLCRRHEVIRAEGVPAETLLPGPQALKAFGAMDLGLILALCPELREPGYVPDAARPVLKGARARRLARRHGKNGVLLTS